MASTTFQDSASGGPLDHGSAHSPFVNVARDGDVLHLSVTGPTINPREAQIIAAEVHRTIQSCGAFRVLVLDLSGVGSMSSFGLGMCVDLQKAAKAAGARVILFGLCRELRELFRMMKVERLFRLVHDEEGLRRELRR